MVLVRRRLISTAHATRIDLRVAKWRERDDATTTVADAAGRFSLRDGSGGAANG
jgi:hypothetical protein